MDFDNVASWFFESIAHVYPNTLRIRLVEGIKGDEPEMVDVTDDQSIGPYYPVSVTGRSRCIDVQFRSVLAYQLVDESFAAPQTDFEAKPFVGPVQKCSKAEYLNYIEKDSIIASRHEGEYAVFYIWTEDQSIFVVATESPSVTLSEDIPDMSIERSLTYFAK